MATTVVLTLGSVVFADFEVPESIRAGGAQAMLTHKYAGGTRTVDTTGPDDDGIPWSGWFEGSNALSRCLTLDQMRRAGASVSLTWSQYSYTVVIKKFSWDFRRFYHIGYSIELEVVQDLLNPPQGTQSSGAVLGTTASQNDIGDGTVSNVNTQIAADATDASANGAVLAA